MSECSQCSQVVSTTNSVESTGFATIEQDQSSCPSSLLVSETEEPCAPRQVSTTTDGGSAAEFTNARETSRMTLLGRIGTKLAKFVGSGYIQVEEGEARLVSFIPLRVRELFHRWVIPAPGQSPVLGEAKPFPYMVIADNNGKSYGVKGLAGEDCLVVWDFLTKAFLIKPLTDFPIKKKGFIQKAAGIELIGFLPPSTACGDPAREVKALNGDGVVFITNEQVESGDTSCCPEGCDCACDGAHYRAVANVVPYPEDSSDKQYLLAWQYGVGLVYIEKPDASEGAPGPPGATGAQGVQGISGAPGAPGAEGPEGPAGPAGPAGPEGPAGDVGDITVTTTTVTVENSKIITAALTPAQNINGASADINFEAASRTDAPWTHAAGAPTFILGDAGVDHVEITANIIFEEAAPGGGIPVAPILDLYKNGVLVVSATSQTGTILDDAAQNTVKASNSIRFVDTATFAVGTSYKLVCRRGNATVTPVTGFAGFFTAKAVSKFTVVTEIELSTP